MGQKCLYQGSAGPSPGGADSPIRQARGRAKLHQRTMMGTLETSGLLAGVGSGLTAIVGIADGFMAPSEAAWLAAGATLALTILAFGSKDVQDTLYPARLQLARFRRSEKAADILVVKLPPVASITRRTANRRSASVAASVLRVTDGVAILPSLRGYGLCAVLEADARARTAIEHRLRHVCGSEVGLGWATFPEHGVTIESLIEAASDRVPERLSPPPRPRRSQLLPGRQLASRSLDPGRAPARRAR